MNTRRLLFLSALCLTMGTTQVSAQGFLKKIKNKGTQMIKEAAPKPVKEVMDAVENANEAPQNNTSANRSGNRTITQNRSTQRVRTNTNRRPSTRTDFEPAHKTITIKLYKGLGIKTWLGRKAFNTPQPPTQCPKQPAWFDALPQVIELDNASLIAESKMINKLVTSGKASCETVLVRRELLNSEVNDRIGALDNAVHYLNNADSENEDDYTPAEPLEEDAFKRTMQSDYSPLYPLLADETVAYLKSINRTSKEVSVRVYEGNSSWGNRMQIGEMWFELNSQRNSARLIGVDNDESIGKDYTVPSTVRYAGRTLKVTEIGSAAFAEMKIKSVTLSPGLKTIGSHAFACTRITSINIPSTVTMIDSYAFHSMPAITSITVPNSVTKIGHSAFSMCTALTEVTLPVRLEKLPNALFFGCKALTKVTLPQNITKIDMSTFEDCKALTNISLPQSVAVIDQNAFKNTALTSVPVTTSLKSIESSAFEGCNRITSVSLPSRVEVEMFAFKNCKALKKVVIGSQYKTRTDELQMIFYGCPFMPQRMTTIPACITFN